MATIDGLARQLNLMRMKIDPPKPPVENFLDSPEWPHILAVCRSVLPAYPEALEAVELAVARMVAPMSWRQVHAALYRAIYDFMDARVELAEKLVGPV